LLRSASRAISGAPWSALLTQSSVFRELGDLSQADTLLAAAEAVAVAPDTSAALTLQIGRARLALLRDASTKPVRRSSP
jgi:hypothetical protein